MAAKKKSKKRPIKSKRTASKKTALRKTAKKKVAKNKPSPKKKTVKAKARSGKKLAPKKAKAPKRQIRRTSRSVDTEAFLPEQLETGSGRGLQSGDLQGVSSAEAADSESVEELLEEGNAFEADVVAGVEDATNSDEREVHTREVPTDDVPEEYLDEE